MATNTSSRTLQFEILRLYYGFCAELGFHEARRTTLPALRAATLGRELRIYIGALQAGEAADWDSAELYVRKLQRCLRALEDHHHHHREQ